MNNAPDTSMKNAPIDPVTLNFDLWTPKQYHFYGFPRWFPTPSLNILGSFVSELCSGQANKQTNRETDGRENPTRADRHIIIVGVGNY